MLRDNLCHLSLTGRLSLLRWLELGQSDQLVVRVAVANVRRQLQVDCIRRLRLFEGQHAQVQIQVSEEDHVVDHE